MDWYNNDVYWIRNNKKTEVLVSYKEGWGRTILSMSETFAVTGEIEE